MKKHIITLSALLGTLLTKAVALAYEIPPEFRPENQPFGFSSGSIASGENAVSGIILILQVVEGGLLYFAAPIGVIMVAYAGLQMIVGGTNDAYTTGRKTIQWALLGLLIIILSYSIVRIAINLFLEFGN